MAPSAAASIHQRCLGAGRTIRVAGGGVAEPLLDQSTCRRIERRVAAGPHRATGDRAAIGRNGEAHRHHPFDPRAAFGGGIVAGADHPANQSGGCPGSARARARAGAFRAAAVPIAGRGATGLCANSAACDRSGQQRNGWRDENDRRRGERGGIRGPGRRPDG
jgi:hypothetical protein